MAMTAAQLAVGVTADTAQLEAGLKKASGQVEGFASGLTSRFASAGQMLGGALAVGAAAAGAGVVAGFGAAVASAAGFEKTMSAVGAVSGATAGEMENLSALALQLGKDTSFSAGEAAGGIEELIKGGLTIQDVLGGGAKAALDLAAAGTVSLAEAAEIASNAVGQFGLTGADLGHVADLIAGAANASSLSVTDFKYSLGAVGAVAKAAGLSFDDTAVAIAEMGKAGIKGSDAGTSLKALIAGLTPSTKPAIAAMRELGLITASGANAFFDATGSMKPMAEIQRLLAEATKNLTNEQRLMAFETIFGSDAIRAASVLAGEGAAGFDEMATAMGKVTAAQVGAAKLDNLAGDIEQLKGSAETAAIMLGMKLTPTLRTLAQGATSGLNAAMPAIEAFGQHAADAVGTIQQAFAGDWSPDAAINPVVNAIGMLATFVSQTALPALQAFGSQAGAFLTGTIIPAAQQLAATALPILQQFADWFGTTALPAIQSFATLVQQNLEPIGAVVAGVAAGFATFTILSTIAGWVAAASGAFATLSGVLAGTVALSPAVAGAIAVMTGPLGLVALAVGALAVAWRTNFLGIQDITANLVAAVTPYIQSIITEVGQSIITEVGRFATEMMPLAISAWQGISAQVTAFMTFISTAIQRDVAAISAFWTTHHATIEAVATRVWEAIEGVVSFAWGNVQSTIKTGLQLLSGDWEGAWNTMKQSLSDNWDAIRSAVGPAWEAIKGAIVAKLKELAESANSYGEGLVNAFTEGIRARADAALAPIREMVQNVRNLLPGSDAKEGPLSDLTASGQAFVETWAAGVASSLGVAKDAVMAVVTTTQKYGIDPMIALALAKAESGLVPTKRNTNGEDSVGLYQMNRSGGQGTGYSVEELQDPWRNAELFLRNKKELFDKLVAQGLSGEELARQFGGLAEVSAKEFWYRYAEAYRELAAQNLPALASATVMPSAPQATPQADSTEWVKNRAAAFKSFYEEVQPPTTLQGALQRMQEAFPELQAMVAEGRDLPNGLDSLAAKMVSLARNTGLNTEAFDRWQAGSLDAQSALEEVVRTAAQADPRFQGLLDSLNVAGASSTTFALDFLNMVAALNEAPTATAATSSAVAAMAGPEVGQQLTATVAGIREEFGQIGPVIEQINALLGAGNELAETQRLAVRGIGRGWSRATEGLQEYVDLLGQAGGSVALVPAAASDIPEAHTGAYVQREGVAKLAARETVLPPGESRGGGTTITNNITVHGVGSDEVADEVIRKLRRQQSMERRGLA